MKTTYFLFLINLFLINSIWCQQNPEDTLITSGCGSTAQFMRHVNYIYHNITPTYTLTVPPYTITLPSVFINNNLQWNCNDHFNVYFEDDLPDIVSMELLLIVNEVLLNS